MHNLPPNNSLQKHHGQQFDRDVLLSALSQHNTVFLESARQDSLNTQNLLFSHPIKILTAHTLDEIPKVFDAIESALAEKNYVAGYCTYEAGYCFENLTTKKIFPSPLLWFGVYEKPLEIPQQFFHTVQNEEPFSITNIRFDIQQELYKHKIETIKQYISEGDTYQVNFTDRLSFEFTGNLFSLYLSLRNKQRVPYSAFIHTENDTILSFSPELFFRRNGKSITTKPMKGTCKRGRTIEEDKELSLWLQNDEKNRSENLMIVDLLRNDLGRICNPYSIIVSEMFAVEKYETVLQMTSTVSGTLRTAITNYELFKALFPCGSVTGAPKIRTMQIIDELEQHPRGVYCGAIGYFSPEEESVFNVAIRTLHLETQKKDEMLQGSMGVGSGIVFDSTPKQEFDECTLKANFLTLHAPPFSLIETLRWENNIWFLFEEHCARMKSSAEYFNIPFHESVLRYECERIVKIFDPAKVYRVRLLLSQEGAMTSEVSALQPIERTPILKLAPERTDSTDKMYFHKTTHRPLYEKYQALAKEERVLDYIFLNEKGEVTEGTFTNILIEKNGILFTPPLASGLIGIYRTHLLKTNPKCVEKTLTIADLQSADALYVCNSVRGMIRVHLKA